METINQSIILSSVCQWSSSASVIEAECHELHALENLVILRLMMKLWLFALWQA